MSIERLTIFHINDLHSQFSNWPHIVGYVRAHRHKASLFVDIGDHADRSHLITEATEGRGNVELLNEAEIDYATIGNNEGVTFSKQQLEQLYAHAQFPVLLANLFEPNGQLPSWARKYEIHTFQNGVKVGLIGWTAPFKGLYEQLGWKCESSFQLLKDIVQEVREQVDIVVLLSHVGFFQDEEIAKEMPDIDIILGSHTHHLIERGKKINQTMITQAGKHGHYFGRLDIKFDTQRKICVDMKETLISANACQPAQSTLNLIKKIEHQSFEKLNYKVATVPFDLAVSWQENTEITQLLCDGLAEWCKESIAMMNAGVILESIPQGQITRGDIHRICPHPINPCIVELTGEELLATIQKAYTEEMRFLKLKGFGFRGKLLGKMIFTGIEIQSNSDMEVLEVRVEGQLLEGKRTYRIATLDMYTFGYLFPEIYKAPHKEYLMPEFLRDILAWKLGQEWA
ncbi:bifunctional metallophosphatase/5'-nucleotidase [Alkalihalobacillus pseudalcaliphilus]|uniref:bifunctional metallophosphatase/5'-nucleotidase n=1 Tax=Alkalihalobacillus pseudalcaliphilus TaxID=79884 RepID=UPI00064DD3FD|nr:bifunctional UDP-sugar hydrolase/5'-nucleotidase [Alkalihalobacillus pseudalcaliphilus]KMK77642.1 nuclease [Alkalihalobacillus pseudalcaliphilus]